MRFQRFLISVLALAMATLPFTPSTLAPRLQTAEAGWKTKVAVVAGGAAAYEFSTIQALTLGTAVAMSTPQYRALVTSLAHKLLTHPLVGPPAFLKAVEDAKRMGDLTPLAAAKLEADVLALQKHPGGFADARPPGFADRPLPEIVDRGVDLAPDIPVLGGMTTNDGNVGAIPGLQAHQGGGEGLPGFDILEEMESVYEKRVPVEVLENWKRGNDFNIAERECFKYNEIAVGGIPWKMLDSYVPGREIVSRKHTQLAKISAVTAASYIKELSTKYKPGTRLYPSARNKELFGENLGVLEGDMYLDVPMQKSPIPQYVLDMAERHDVIIRQRPERCKK